MKTLSVDAIASTVLAGLGLVLITGLLLSRNIGEASFVALVGILAFVCLAILGFSRIRELDIRNLKFVLDKIEAVKAEIAEMYGGIEHLRKTPLKLDDARMESLGLNTGGIPTSTAVMRYTAGCKKRERERLARVFVNTKTPESLAGAILDGTLDELVFKWNGPESPLDQPPKPTQDRLKDGREPGAK